MKIRGSYVAIATPFDRKGNIDKKSLIKLVEWQIAQGTDGLVCCGATGEGVGLSHSERLTVAKICIEAADGRIPIIIGSGCGGTKESVQLTEKAQRLGAKACLIVTPYYNRPTQRGCILHMQEIGKVGLPVIVYHNPGRTVVRLTVDTVARLAEVPGVAALKDSSADIELIRKFAQYLPVLAGDDDMTFEILKVGGVGAISVIGNVFPKMWKRMIMLSLEGRWEMAKRINDRYMPMCKANFIETNPQGVKFAMEWLGICNGRLRLPLVPVLEETANEIKRTLIALFMPHFQRVKLQLPG